MRRVQSGLELVFWGWLVDHLVGVSASAFYAVMLDRLRAGGGSSSDFFDLMQTVGTLTQLLSAAAMCISLVGVRRVFGGLATGTPEEQRARGPARLAFFGLTVQLTLVLLEAALQRSDHAWQPGTSIYLLQRCSMWLGIFLAPATWAVLLVGMHRLARAWRRPLPLWIVVAVGVAIAWALALPLYFQLAAPPTAAGFRWVRLIVSTALLVPFLLALWKLARVDTSGLPRAFAEIPEGLGGTEIHGPAWAATAAGLETYRGAIVGKLVVLVIAVLVMGLAIFGRSHGLVKGVAVLWPLAELILSFVLLAGLVGYCAVPHETGARETSVLATVAVALVLLLQLYGFWLIIVMTGGDDGGDYREKLAAAKRVPVLETVAQMGALAGVLLLLASFRALATWLGASRIAARTVGLSFAVIATMTAAGLFRWALLDGKLRSTDAVVLSALVLLVVAIATLASYLGVLRDLAGELRARLAAGPTPETGLPPAAPPPAPPPTSTP